MSEGHRLKRLRRLSTEEDTDGSDAWTPGSVKPPSPPKTTRPTRRAAAAATTAIIENERDSMKLHAKTPPSRLKEVTGGGSRPTRGSRRRAIVEESSSEDEEDEEDAEGEDEDEEMVDAEEDEDEEEEEEEEEDDDEDAAGEDEDEEMEDAPPPPPPTKSRAQVAKPVAKPAAKPVVKPVAPAPRITKSAVAAAVKDIEESDDDELSSLGSLDEDEEEVDAEGEEADEDMDETNVNVDEEMEEEEEEEDAEGEEDEEIADNDSDGTPVSGEDTPDLSRLTRRQRAVHDLEDFDESLVSLSNEAQKKKHLTAEEYAMRRAEMARRRKNLSEKRNEEEKLDTINRLLKRQAPKRRKKDEKDENDENGRAPASFVRMISTVEGTKLAVPDQWLVAPVGEMFNHSEKLSMKSAFPQKMVEEVN